MRAKCLKIIRDLQALGGRDRHSLGFRLEDILSEKGTVSRRDRLTGQVLINSGNRTSPALPYLGVALFGFCLLIAMHTLLMAFENLCGEVEYRTSPVRLSSVKR